MPAKTTILGALEEHTLLLPDLLEESLAANERIKYYFSLLQLACLRADAPDAGLPDLRAERLAAGVADEQLDGVIAASRRLHGDLVRIPRAGDLVDRALADVDRMVEPLRAAARDGAGASGEALAAFERRLGALSLSAPRPAGDAISSAQVADITTAQRAERDSLHLLVMDLHKALNDLAARVAARDVGGARVHALEEGDEPLVLAFMRGVDRTRRLKLDHPGLGTIAGRARGRLVIQNDLGTTDAHVVVIHVEGLSARVTYTDVHPARLEFFQSLFDGLSVAWEDTRSRRIAGLAGGEAFFLCVGTFRAESREHLAEHLGFLGSRLVFLIDWNRARRNLGSFVKKPASVALLKRAADEEYGHRGFLELGGERLVFDAMAAVMRTPFRFGERLSETLGDEQTAAYLRYVMRTAAEGLLEGRSRSLLRQKVQAELVGHFHSASERLLDLVAEHARVVGDLGAAAREALRAAGAGAPEQRAERARLAREREKRADEIVIEVRALAERLPGTGAVRRIAEVADDAADELEEAVFHLELSPLGDGPMAQLSRLSELCASAAAEYLRGIDVARRLHRGADRAAVDEFLAAIDRVVALEHETDEAERAVIADLFAAERADAREVFAVSHAARDFEAATDALLHAALALRDHVLGEVMAR